MTCSFSESVLRCFLARTSPVSPDRPPVFPGCHLCSYLSITPRNVFPILRVHTADFEPAGRAGFFRPQHVTARFVYAVFKVRAAMGRYRTLSSCSGGHLLSRTVSSAVPSAAWVLTVVFGMGTGVAPMRIAARCFRGLALDSETHPAPTSSLERR